MLEALTADRPYQRQPMTLEGVEAVLTTGGGTQFDEDCVAACMDGVVELAVAFAAGPPRRAGRVGVPSRTRARYHAAGTSRPMFSPSNLFKSDPAVEDVEPDPDDEDVDRRDAPASLQEMLRARLPRVIVTPAILAVIVAIFVVMVVVSGEVAFSSKTLVRWGAQFGPGVANGQWWRLLSAMWLHAHPLHLALNAIFLWRFGDYVERLLGPVVFLIVYVLAGVVASAVSLQFHGLSVGASGAIFGLVGVLLTVAMTSRGRGGLGEMLAELRPNLISIVVANLFLGFLMQGVDNAAHIGGLAGGLVLGWLVGRHSLDATPSPRLTLIPIVMTAAIAAAAVLSVGARQDVRAEAARVGMQIDRAEAAFRVARADIAAGKRTRGGRGRRGRDYGARPHPRRARSRRRYCCARRWRRSPQPEPIGMGASRTARSRLASARESWRPTGGRCASPGTTMPGGDAWPGCAPAMRPASPTAMRGPRPRFVRSRRSSRGVDHGRRGARVTPAC